MGLLLLVECFVVFAVVAVAHYHCYWRRQWVMMKQAAEEG